MKQIGKYHAIIAILTFNSFYLPVQAEEVTIGVVNTPRIIQQSPQGKELQAELQKEFSDRKQDLLSRQEKLQEMQEKMEKDSAIMSQTEGQELQRQIARLQRELKRDQAAFQEDLQYRRKQELSSVRQEIVEAIQSLAKQNGYDLVIDQGVAHASNQINITDQVIEYLKESAG